MRKRYVASTRHTIQVDFEPYMGPNGNLSSLTIIIGIAVAIVLLPELARALKAGNKVVTRVGYRFDDEGNKIRVAKRTGEDI